MDKKLDGFIKRTYEMAKIACDSDDVRLYAANAGGACAYEYERTGDKSALDLWDNKWRKEFIDLFKICS